MAQRGLGERVQVVGVGCLGLCGRGPLVGVSGAGDLFEQVTPGTQSPIEFDSSVADLVGFMTWMAEPAQSTRIRIGVWVLLFLGVLTVFVWRLSAAYWRSVT